MYTFSWILAAGAALGLAWAAWLAPPGQSSRTVDDGLLVLVGALVGGRLAYILPNWGYYRVQWTEIPQLWQGGLSILGALIGCLLVVFLLALWTHRSWGLVADPLLPLFAMLAVSGWLACWAAGFAYGPRVQGVWWGVPAKDESGLVSSRWPVQPLGALLTLLWTWVLEWIWQVPKRPPGLWQKVHPLVAVPGQAASLEWLGIALIAWGLSLKRVDPVLFWHGMRIDAWAALFVGAFSLGMYLLARIRQLLGRQPASSFPQPQDVAKD